MLRAGDRVSLKQEGAVCELEIRGLTVEDTGQYSCMCGQERTSATLTIKGKGRQRPQGPVASCLRVVSVTGSTTGFCGFSCLCHLGPCRCLLAPGSLFSRCECAVLCVLCSLWTFASITICASLYLFVLWSFAVCGVLCPGESYPESLMFSVTL